jgi:hypothetical protein
MASRKMKQSGAAIFAALSIATASVSPSQAWFRAGGCFACGGRAFAAGAIAGAAIARPIYYPPRYLYPVPAYPVYPAYPTCPVVAPVPYYCR